ncbi:MAG: class I SAM-dependent DNA methyltransferase [Cyanobacteria bacterium P01_G01_bin.54]
MITGDLKSKVDKLWETFWSNGISNSLSVIEQVSYLLFIKRLDEGELLRERKAKRFGPVKNPVFGEEYEHCRWSKFKNIDNSREMLEVVRDQVFPFIKTLGDKAAGSTYSQHMKDATFLIANEALLKTVIAQIDRILDNLNQVAQESDDKTYVDLMGDLYEYMLSKLTEAGRNGQFRTPRHIIRMMVEMMEPTVQDLVCDPACGTAGFLVSVAQYLQGAENQYGSNVLNAPGAREHFNSGMFHGFDFDATMLRIGSMNLMLHGIQDPKIEARDSLSEDHAAVEDAFTLVLANPPFKGSLDYDSTAKDLQAIVKTKKTELLFVALFLRLLKTGGRAAVIVPDGVLFGSSKAHKALRKTLVEDHKLEGVVSMPSGVFKPYAGVSTAILIFTKTGAGGTDQVWFYDMQADGLSLDDKRQPVAENDIPDVLVQWRARGLSVQCPEPVVRGASPAGKGQTDPGGGRSSTSSDLSDRLNDRKAKAFVVPRAEIAENGYDLSINRYKEIEYEEVEYEAPAVILGKLRDLEDEIRADLDALEAML